MASAFDLPELPQSIDRYGDSVCLTTNGPSESNVPPNARGSDLGQA